MFTGLILSGILATAPQLAPAGTAAPPAPAGKPDPAFARLYTIVQPPASQPEPNRQEPVPADARGPRRKVVCGMTLLLVGPEADADMVRPAPKEGPTFTMRRVAPPVCGKER